MKVNKTKKRDDAWNFVCNCYDHHPGDTNEEKTEIKMSEYRSECRMGNWLLFTHHYPARCFGMNMPKSRDIQAKIPLPQAIWNEFWLRYKHNLQISLIPCHAIRLDICI